MSEKDLSKIIKKAKTIEEFNRIEEKLKTLPLSVLRNLSEVEMSTLGSVLICQFIATSIETKPTFHVISNIENLEAFEGKLTINSNDFIFKGTYNDKFKISFY